MCFFQFGFQAPTDEGPARLACRRRRLARSLPLLLAGGLLAGFVQLARADDDDQARAIVEKAIRAHGGAENLAKLQTCRITSKGTVDMMVLLGNKNQFGLTTWDFDAIGLYQLPGKYKQTWDLSVFGQKAGSPTIVLNGDDGWTRNNGKTTSLSDEQLKEAKAGAREQHATTLVPLLEDKSYKLSVVEETKVKGKDAVGIRVKVEGLQPILLFFDKNTGLLLKSERRAYLANARQEVRQERYYANYKDVAGVRYPHRWVTCFDGTEAVAGTVTELKPLKKIPDDEFEEP